MQQMKQSHDTYGSNQDAAPDAQLMPWSYRLPIWGRFLVDLVSGIIVGVVGTMAHRMGASMNIPLRIGDRLSHGDHFDMVSSITRRCLRPRIAPDRFLSGGLDGDVGVWSGRRRHDSCGIRWR